ncbi:MAG: hypothetical protein ACJAV5_001224 [Vicingaceae bacterium]
MTPYGEKNNMKAIWNDTIIAESKDTVMVEGNHYFPIQSLKKEYIKESKTTSICPWKGTASYFSLQVKDKRNEDAAWFYSTPKAAAVDVLNRVAFWKGVNIVDS